MDGDLSWAAEADLLETLEARCREMADLAKPLNDLEFLGRLTLVAARIAALEEALKERLRREDEAEPKR